METELQRGASEGGRMRQSRNGQAKNTNRKAAGETESAPAGGAARRESEERSRWVI